MKIFIFAHLLEKFQNKGNGLLLLVYGKKACFLSNKFESVRSRRYLFNPYQPWPSQTTFVE